MRNLSQPSPEIATLSSFSIDDFRQYKTGGYVMTCEDSIDISTSTSQNGALEIDASQLGVDILEAALSPSFEQVNNYGHQNSSYHKPSQSGSSQQDFSAGNVGGYTALFPLASPRGTLDMGPVDYTRESDEGQHSPTLYKTPSSRQGAMGHCSCSQAALTCLDRISTVPFEAQYTDRLHAIQSAFLTTERLVFCTTCTPNMIIAKSCFILGNAHEMMAHMNSQLEEGLNNTLAAYQAKEDVRRIKRRAAMIFAGLKTLQDPDSGDDGMSNIQSEFLLGLARSWSSLSEP